MTALAWLIPCALLLGGLGLAAFLWSLRDGQYDDLEGAGWRALEDHEGPDVPRATGADRAAAEPTEDKSKADSGGRTGTAARETG